MKINTNNFEMAQAAYSLERPSILHKVKEFMQSSKPLTIGCATAMACFTGAVAAAAYGSSVELSILQEHGKNALDAYRDAAQFHISDFDSLTNFAKATMNETLTPAKAMVLGFIGGTASFFSAVAVKAASVFTPETPSLLKIKMQFNSLQQKGHFDDQSEMGSKIGEYAKMGTIDRWMATKDTPGLFSLVNSFESLAADNSTLAKMGINYMNENTEPANQMRI